MWLQIKSKYSKYSKQSQEAAWNHLHCVVMFYEEFYIPCVVLSYSSDINLDAMQETVHEFRVCHKILPRWYLIKLMSEG